MSGAPESPGLAATSSTNWDCRWRRFRPLKLVFVDDHRLVAGGGDPFLHCRERHDHLAIGVRVALELELVGPEAGYDRGVGRVGNAEMAEQEIAFAFTKAFAAVAPNRHDAVDLR